MTLLCFQFLLIILLNLLNHLNQLINITSKIKFFYLKQILFFSKTFIVSEVFKEIEKILLERFLKEKDLFLKLFSFLKPREELNSINSLYFSKVVQNLMLNNLTEVQKLNN